MSASRRKIPICGICNIRSEKAQKRCANRVWRRKVKGILHANPEAEVLPLLREVGDIRSWPKDGKAFFDPVWLPKLMRK